MEVVVRMRRSVVGSQSALALGVRSLTIATALLLTLASAASAITQGILVGAGSSWVAADAEYDLGCNDPTNTGDLDLGTPTFAAVHNFSTLGDMIATAASVSVGGNWSNTGTFDTGTSAFYFTDDCEEESSTITGETTFPSLSIIT